MALTGGERRLIVFARAPVPGRCKTRLIPRFGAAGAARLHRLLTLRTLDTATAVNARLELWCAPDTNHAFFHACRRRHVLELRRQPPGDLGRKMGIALAHALRHGADAAVIVGTDCAALTSSDIEAAFAALEAGSDCVLQPASDGGYVLIGARVARRGMLHGIDWSSGRELVQTRTRMARLGLSVSELPTLWDVDRPRDVMRARREGLLTAGHGTGSPLSRG